MKDDVVYLDYMLECIRRVEENTAAGWGSLLASHTLQDAVLRNLQTMAESLQRLSEKLRKAHPEVEWTSISAFRNVLVHDYAGIKMEIVWKIIQQDLPRLKAAVAAMLAEKSQTEQS